MDLVSVQRAYRRYAPHYDRLFGPVFEAGRKAAVGLAAGGGGRRVLEVGVGTGLSLPYYPPDCSVVGIDVSPDMLEVARRRAADRGLGNVEALLQMDAENLELPDASFDAVVAMYVATVVPNPDRLLREMARVCRPGGELVVVGHFASRNHLMRGIESVLLPLSKLVGFRTGMTLDALPEPDGVERLVVRPVNFLGFSKVVHWRRLETGARPEPRVAPERVARERVRADLRPSPEAGAQP